MKEREEKIKELETEVKDKEKKIKEGGENFDRLEKNRIMGSQKCRLRGFSGKKFS